MNTPKNPQNNDHANPNAQHPLLTYCRAEVWEELAHIDASKRLNFAANVSG